MRGIFVFNNTGFLQNSLGYKFSGGHISQCSFCQELLLKTNIFVSSLHYFLNSDFKTFEQRNSSVSRIQKLKFS